MSKNDHIRKEDKWMIKIFLRINSLIKTLTCSLLEIKLGLGLVTEGT